MKISWQAREKYEIEKDHFSERGNIQFEGEVHPIRKIVQNINKKRDLINYPEMAVKTSEIYSNGLMFKIKEHVFELYLEQLNSDYKEQLYSKIKEKN